MKAKVFLAAVGMSALLIGCVQNTARVTGRFTGHCAGMVYLEQITPAGQYTVDSATLGGKGDFRFRVHLPEGQTTLYNLRYGVGAIPLMLSAGERARVSSICDVALNYTVGGSTESERIRELQMLLMHGGLKLDSLRKAVLQTEDEAQRTAYVEYMTEMNRLKREHLHFIVSQPGRLSSLYALYQRLAGEQNLFSANNDIVYYRLVADSTAVNHPDSPYVRALQREVKKTDNMLSISDLLAQKWQEGGDGYPDLALPDIYGSTHTLSDFKGRVIVIDFWHSGDPNAGFNNREMKQLYERAHKRGLEIYQVSLDTEKALWVTAVQEQKLPWVSVGDMLGVKSPAATNYNISRLPTNFLISREGVIVGRDLFGEKLEAEVDMLLQQI